MKSIKIIDTNAENLLDFGVCSYKSLDKEGYPEKVEWLNKRFKEGLKLKTLYSEKDGPQGMIEYIPGKYCWRPVEADGYMFIHCLFVGYKKQYKGKGYGSLLIEECIKDAKSEKMSGVAVVTRKGAFMVSKDVFLKHGFEVVDKAPPDFQLMVKKFDKKAKSPSFTADIEKNLNKYSKGLTVIRTDQCPYTVKNVNEIMKTAKSDFGVKPRLVELKNHKEAKSSPCAFGSFCIIINGKIVAHHPISNTRFKNIMNKEMK
jgi:hypothetical protein